MLALEALSLLVRLADGSLNDTMEDRVQLDSNSGAAVSASAEVARGSLRIWLKYLERLARGEARR